MRALSRTTRRVTALTLAAALVIAVYLNWQYARADITPQTEDVGGCRVQIYQRVYKVFSNARKHHSITLCGITPHSSSKSAFTESTTLATVLLPMPCSCVALSKYITLTTRR